MAKYDIYHIEERLREWHPSFVRLEWEDERKIHKVIMRDALNLEYTAMHVPHGQLDARVLYRMMEINPERGYNPFHEIDRNIRERERAENHRIEEMAYDFASNFRRPLIEDYFY